MKKWKIALSLVILTGLLFGQTTNITQSPQVQTAQKQLDQVVWVATAATLLSSQQVNGGTFTIDDRVASEAQTWEVNISGTAPASTSITISPCMRGGTCGTNTTSTSTTSVILTSTGLFDRFKLTVSWTGGDATTVIQVNRTAGVARAPTSGGTGTVSANNGSAGAVANYAAAGGSTTVGPDAALTDTGTTLTYTGSTLVLPLGSLTTPAIQATGSASNSGFYFPVTTSFCNDNIGVADGCLSSTGLEANATGTMGWPVSGGANGAKDTGISRGGVATVNIGNGAAADKTGIVQARRYNVDGGTTLVIGDFVLSAGWGTTASLAITVATSKDSSAVVTVTSAGTGQAANPTIAFTFHDGTFTNVPGCIAIQTGGTGIFGDTTVTTRSATAYTWQWNATATAAATYEFTILCQGT